ncbi:hypothetical protein L1987_30982 [Smallanthus sonchifolius]|uniref:Uncharacterized protein n=1 Tax=Smallanthus sonchifolius TaxID=185202 RepID=A0ACB9I3N5_9ASTR|nr:hypothetical protein L1987_30982 [Smallanthus sonchifolius]
MNMPPPHRRKTPSFSSSLLDSILRSIDDGGLHDDTLHHHQQQVKDHDHDLMFFASEPKRSSKNVEEQMPSLRRAIMIDQWMETHNNHNRNGYGARKSCREFVSDSSSSTETETPSTYRSLPNSFTISRETVFQTPKREGKFIKSTKLRAMKIYGDLKKVNQPISPGSRISAFIYSLFASSSKKAKMEESMQNFRSLKKSRSIKQDTATTCTSISRSCMSKKQHSSSVKRSVRFYPENDTVILDRKSNHERQSDSMSLPKYERRWFTEKKFMVNIEDDDEDEDDLFELEITGAYTQELPVFETTDLRRIRI